MVADLVDTEGRLRCLRRKLPGFRQAAGVAGVTRRGSQTEEHGRPLWVPRRQLADIRRRNSAGRIRESELPIVPIDRKDNTTLREGRGNTFIVFLK